MGRLHQHRQRTIEDVFNDTIPEAWRDRLTCVPTEFTAWVESGCVPFLDLVPGDEEIIAGHLLGLGIEPHPKVMRYLASHTG